MESRRNTVLRVGAMLACVLALTLAKLPHTGSAAAQDWAIPNGWFFTQTGDGIGRGFSVTDEYDIRFWTEFQRLGGANAMGYPVSRRFQWNGFTCQAMQRVVFQWRPEQQRVLFVNVFDLLTEAGKDDWLLSARQTPRPGRWNEAGMPWEQIKQQRLAVLQQYPDIGNAYYGVAGDAVGMNGLPVAEVAQLGDAFVLRAQRVVILQWLADKPWARRGQVTFGLGGDIAKEAGLLPKAALAQMTATTRDRGTIAMASPLPPSPAIGEDLEATRRVFAVYAFINAAGYDDDNDRGFGPLRRRVRESVAASLDRDLLERMRRLYRQRSSAIFVTYGAYAVTLGGAGPFFETPYTPRVLRGMAPLLNEFYPNAKIGALWEANKHEFQSQLRVVLPLLSTPAQEVFDYSQEVSLPASGYAFIPNPLEAYGRASTSKREEERYILQGPSSSTSAQIHTFRHEFAHSITRPIVEENDDLIDRKRILFQQVPRDVARYYQDWPTFVDECLVRAVTARVADLTTPTPGEGDRMIRSDMQRGFYLVGLLAEQLKAYEVSHLSLRQFAPRMFAAIE